MKRLKAPPPPQIVGRGPDRLILISPASVLFLLPAPGFFLFPQSVSSSINIPPAAAAAAAVNVICTQTPDSNNGWIDL